MITDQIDRWLSGNKLRKAMLVIDDCLIVSNHDPVLRECLVWNCRSPYGHFRSRHI